MAKSPKWKSKQLWKNKYKKPSGASWVNPGDPFGTSSTMPPNAGATVAAAANPPAAPPATPPAAPPPPKDYGNPAPDRSYTINSGAALTGRDNQLASIAAQRTALNEQYGFDPNTGTFAENVDVTNPYSRAALLNKSYMQMQKGSAQNYANRGSLTSGAYLAALQSDANSFNQSKKGLEQDFAARRADFLAQENAANLDYETKMADLQDQLMQRRMAEDAPTFGEQDNPTDPTPPPSAMQDFLKTILDAQKPKAKKPKKKKGKR